MLKSINWRYLLYQQVTSYRRMYIIKLKIFTSVVINEDLIDAIDSYLIYLFRSKQIINEEFHYIPTDKGLQLYLYCPEKDSYLDKNSNKHTIKFKQQLINNFQSKLEFEFISIDPEFGEITIPEKSKFMILKYSRISSLLDGETLDEIPFYKIPFTSRNSIKKIESVSHENLHNWECSYHRIKGIWYGCQIGEKWSQDQLQNLTSDLSQSGVECCEKIEEVTGIPTYYFLMNWRAWGRKKDKERKCPNCNGGWLMEGRTFNDHIAFKSDNC